VSFVPNHNFGQQKEFIMSVNKFIAIGHLVRKPETRSLPSGKTVTNFSIAINGRPYTDRDGNEKKDVTFIDAQAWEKGGELIAEHFDKGDPIYIEGELRQDTWEDKNNPGQMRSKHYVRVLQFEFLPRSNRDRTDEADGNDAPAAQEPKTRTRKPSTRKAATRNAPPKDDDNDDNNGPDIDDDGGDIPF